MSLLLQMSINFNLSSESRRGKNIRFRVGGSGRTTIMGEGGTYHEQISKRNMTPNQLASYNLLKTLELDYSEEVSRDLRNDWKREMENIPELRYMNMKHLATALVIINLKHGEIDTDTFNDVFLDRFLVKLEIILGQTGFSPQLKIRHKEVLLTYMRKIIFFRNQFTFDQPVQQLYTVEQDSMNEFINELPPQKLD